MIEFPLKMAFSVPSVEVGTASHVFCMCGLGPISRTLLAHKVLCGLKTIRTMTAASWLTSK